MTAPRRGTIVAAAAAVPPAYAPPQPAERLAGISA